MGVPIGTDQLIGELPALYAVGDALEDLAVRHPKLDEVFLALTGQSLEEPAVPTKKGRRGAHAA